MTRISETDVALLRERLYAAGSGLEPWSGLLPALATTFSARRVTIHVGDTEGTASAVETWPVAPEGMLEYDRTYAGQDLRADRIVRGGRRGVMTTADLMSPGEIARCPVHNEHYRRWPECWQNLLAAVEYGARLVVPTLHRHAADGAFEEDIVRAMRVLAPDFARAWSLPIADPGLATDDYEALIESLEEGLIIVDRRMRVLRVNAAARALIDAAQTISIEDGIPTAVRALSRQQVDAALAAAVSIGMRGSTAGPREIVVAARDGSSVLLDAHPIIGSAKAAAMLRIRPIRTPTLPTIDDVVEAFGVTRSQAELALALARGRRLADHAAERQISLHTARTHLRDLRERIGAARQSDVVRMVFVLSR
ncbi:helix-turn-helix transcriptional regulator [Salinarimonas ramus]|uniref:DNA-binding transcriptional regulator, CsgD family n=1 Tax=Salinarimonas ramus TaxID=690164 RepID=A0A917VAA1_9HYPH|nr:helix-turn-helix transcriptional regulator [Salinarimonas ramus]GGK55172.1 hypothetical protein GCM10011322_47330 [Salinarimonas ramus]